MSAARQQDATLRLLAAYRAHATSLEARLGGGVAAPSTTLVRLMEEEDRLRASALRQLESESALRTRATARGELADMVAAQRKEAQMLRASLSTGEVRVHFDRERDQRERDREIEQLRQENSRLRAALREVGEACIATFTHARRHFRCRRDFGS